MNTDRELRGRSQELLDEWQTDLKAGWLSVVDELPPSRHYLHWLEEQVIRARAGQEW